VLSPNSITTKLMAIVVVIAAGYALLIGLFLFTLNHIKHTGDTALDRNVARLTENAKLGRELVYILSDTNHVTTSFYKNDDLLKKQSKIIISRTNSLIPGSHDVQLTKILEEFEEKVHLVFEKCFAINNLHSEIESMTNEYKTYAGSIEQIIDSRMAKRTLRGEKLSDLRMLRQMIPGILVTVGDIDNTFNVLGIEYFKTATIETDHPIFNLADDLRWRIYHIGDAEPSVRDTTRQFTEKINEFKQTILVFNMDAKDLHKSLIEMNIKKDDLLKYLEESDLLLKKESVGMKRKMADAFLLYRNFMLIFSIGLVIIILFMAVFFIVSNIKKPMALINEGLESISKGDLNTTIKLNRKDEWAMIETALNRMVSELKSSYGQIQRSKDNLEKKVTERTRDLEITNKELELAKEASEAANQAKSMFLSNMSHELRTPLNAILGFSQLMGRDLTIGKEQQERISIIGRSGTHLLSLIDDILDIAKIETGRETLYIKSFYLPALLSEISELFHSRIIEKGLSFTVEKNDDIPRYIKSDEGKLRQVLVNLLDNALKYTETGSVTLRVRPGTLAENIQTLHIEVEDTGIGIDPDHLENIFYPFVQVGHVRTGLKGTGLGLAICQSFMELLSGEISVESKPGKGSLFRINLAVALAESAEAGAIEKAGPAVLGLEPGQSAWRILVVEDNAENRLLLNSLLVQVGFDIRQAENGDEAVTLFKQWQPHFIWMDMRMPVMDGYQATAKIRSLPGGDTVKIVAITASAFKEQRESILEAGCDEVVYKPFQAHEIFETIREQIGVCYIYEEELDKPPSLAGKVIDIALAKEMSASLPEQLLDELEQAAIALDMEETYVVLERIAEIQPELAGMLRMRVEEMDFSTIRRALNRE
jgi:signal transduction histidine kinase/CheY-like chemotaxis protein